MPRNALLGKGRVTIASGAGNVQLPEYVTLRTGSRSHKSENVEVEVRRGNKVQDPIYSKWKPMHGVRVSYRFYHENKVSTVYDDHTVTFLTTGPWKVQVELPVE